MNLEASTRSERIANVSRREHYDNNYSLARRQQNWAYGSPKKQETHPVIDTDRHMVHIKGLELFKDGKLVKRFRSYKAMHRALGITSMVLPNAIITAN